MRIGSGEFRRRLPEVVLSQVQQSVLEKRSNTVWQRTIPSIVSGYERLGAPEVLSKPGIPPLLGSPNGLNTKSSAIAISLELLKGLSPASNIKEAMKQVEAVLNYVRDEGIKARIQYLSIKNFLQIDFQSTSSVDIVIQMIANLSDITHSEIPYFSFTGPEIYPLSQFQRNGESMYMGISYTRHALIIGRNGSIQILKMPNATELIDMIKHDDRAARYILRDKPLYDSNAPIVFSDRDKLIDHLRNEELLKARTGPSMDNDVNRLFRNAPFDIPRHIRAGRLEVVLDKVGANGLTLWQETKDDFYRTLRNEIE